MSSLLEPGKDCWGLITSREKVEVNTVDNYCSHVGVTNIDVLKSDTQGFDLEVLRGARGMLEQRRIHLVYIEIIFSDIYQQLPRFDEIYCLLAGQGFFLVSFYEMHYQNDRASWMDALFINPEYKCSVDLQANANSSGYLGGAKGSVRENTRDRGLDGEPAL
jgi:hypothetical protein